MNVTDLLEMVRNNELSIADAARFLEGYGFVQLGYQKLDVHRTRRTSIPEAVLALAKSLEQIVEIVSWYAERRLPLLITKVSAEKGEELLRLFPQLAFDPVAGVLQLGHSQAARQGRVAVVSAGSSDYPVAREAIGTLEFFGIDTDLVMDCGVAGLHRLFASGEVIAAADIIIVVAGMEGALASVVGGLFRQPLIAVPTSVGYGASFGGLSALLTMLNSCAPGVTVVNIDNGFGAAVAAKSMLEMARALRDSAHVAGATARS
jgi:NCAIR mutase (PurE)-related protein